MKIKAALLLSIFFLTFLRDAHAFTLPLANPPGGPTLFTAERDPAGLRKFGIGTFNFIERLNVAGNIFYGDSITPKLLGGITSGIPAADAIRVVVDGNYAYVAFAGIQNSGPPDQRNVIRVINVATTTEPRIIGGNALIPGLPGVAPTGMSVAGRHAYMSFNDGSAKTNHIRIIDVSTSTLAVLGGDTIAPQATIPLSPPTAVAAVGRYLYAGYSGSSATNRFRIFDISSTTPVYATMTASVSVGTVPNHIAVSGGYAYLVNSSNDSLTTIDVTNPQIPVLGTEVSLGTALPARGIQVLGSLAYVLFGNAGESRIRIVDISDPKAPLVVGGGALDGLLPPNAAALQVAGRYAYIIFGNAEGGAFRIVDLRNRGSPAIVGGDSGLTGFSGFTALAVGGRYLYLAGNGKFQIADLGGIEGVSGIFHSLEAGTFIAHKSMSVNNQVQVRGGLTVGGASALYGTTTFRGLNVVPAIGSAIEVSGVKSFLIDHPLEPEKKVLRYASVEAPELKTFYDGVTVLDEEGSATVELPAYVQALNRDFRYQLSSIDGRSAPNLYLAKEMSENRFVIAGGRPFQRVSWQLTGIRRDRYAERFPLVVEEEKPFPFCLYEALCGK